MKSLSASVALIVVLLLLALYSTPVDAHLIGSNNLVPNNADATGIAGWRTFLYVVDNDAGKIFVYRQSDQSFYEDHELRGGNNDPFGIVIIGNDMWVGDDDDDKMYHYTIASSGGISPGTLDINFAAVNDDPRGMAVRDIRGTKYIYVVDNFDDYVYVYNVSARGLDTPRNFDLSVGNNNPWGVWVQGDTLWAGDRDDRFIRAHDLSHSNERLVDRKFVELAPENSDPRAFWSDGASMWVLDKDDAKFYKYELDGRRDRGADFKLGFLKRRARGHDLLRHRGGSSTHPPLRTGGSCDRLIRRQGIRLPLAPDRHYKVLFQSGFRSQLIQFEQLGNHQRLIEYIRFRHNGQEAVPVHKRRRLFEFLNSSA